MGVARWMDIDRGMVRGRVDRRYRSLGESLYFDHWTGNDICEESEVKSAFEMYGAFCNGDLKGILDSNEMRWESHSNTGMQKYGSMDEAIPIVS